MTGVIAKRYEEVIPNVSISNFDGTNVVDFYDVSRTEDNHLIAMHHRRPDEEDGAYIADTELTKIEDPSAFFGADDLYVTNVGHLGAVSNFIKTKKYPILLNILGYSWQNEEEETGGSYERWIEFNYPTTKKINEVLDLLSPGEGLRFESYSGGEFSATEFAEAFIENLVLVAEKQTYQIHDHTGPHVIGYIGLQGQHLEDAKTFTASYLARYKAELNLPAVPGMDRRLVTRFLYPSLEVLKGILNAADNLSFGISNKVFLKGIDEDDDRSYTNPLPLLESEINEAYSIYTNNRLHSGIPQFIFERPDHQTILRYALETEERYRMLAERAGQLSVSI